MDPRLIAFVGVAALLTIAPGPDMALVLRNSLARGQGSVLPTALGICAGCVIWGAASSVGIAAVLNTSAQLYDALRLAGAAYLVFLGLRTLVEVWRTRPDDTDAAASGRQDATPQSNRSAFRQGLISNLLNPKVGLFYTTFLPQFIAPGQNVFLMSIALASVHATMGLVWLTLYGNAAVRLGDVIRRGRARRAIETATAGILVAFGVAVAVERR
jgi:threonine/homoserine/homoserine lactone efflux protein